MAPQPAAIEEYVLYAAIDEGSISSTSAYVTACLTPFGHRTHGHWPYSG